MNPDAEAFVTTRMSVGDEVAEADTFLDQVELGIEQMLGEIQTLRRRIATVERGNEARMYDIRVALERLLMRLGGPTGQPSGVIDPNGRDVPLYSPSPPMTAPPPKVVPHWHAPPRGPVSDAPPPPAVARFAPPAQPQPVAGFAPPTANPHMSAPSGFPASGFPPPPANIPPTGF